MALEQFFRARGRKRTPLLRKAISGPPFQGHLSHAREHNLRTRSGGDLRPTIFRQSQPGRIYLATGGPEGQSIVTWYEVAGMVSDKN